MSLQSSAVTARGRDLGARLLVLLVLLGAVLRLRQAVFNRSLWLDEALLANNVVQRPLDTLLGEPLASNQGAPAGFLALTDLLTTALGPTDLVLRLVPVVSGVLALLVAYRLSLLVLGSPAGRATFIGLMAAAPVLVYYASEFKQYSSDVLVSLVILWAGLRYDQNRHGPAVLAAVGAVGLWFSHPAVFTLAAVGAVLAVEALRRRQWRALLPLAAVATLWMLSFAADYLLSLRSLAANRSLIAYWRLGYAPVLIDSLAELRWYWDSALGFVFLAFGERGLVDPLPRPEWFNPLNWVLLAVVLVGGVHLFWRARRMAGFALFSVALTVIASGLKLYPFRARMILFLTPLIFLAAASAVDWLAGRSQRVLRASAWAAAAALVALLLMPSLTIVARPHNHSDIKGALTYVAAQRQPGDTVALSVWSEAAYRFYAPQFGLAAMPVVAAIPRENDADAFLRTLCQRAERGAVWIIFSHRFDERLDFLTGLRAVAPQLAAWEGDGAGAYRLDFSAPSTCADRSGRHPVQVAGKQSRQTHVGYVQQLHQ